MAKSVKSRTSLPYVLLENVGASPANPGDIFLNGSNAEIFTGLGVRNMTFVPVFARKSATELLYNDTTLNNDPDLKFTIGASEIWVFMLNLIHFMETFSTGLVMGWSAPAGTTMRWAPTAAEGNNALTESDTRTRTQTDLEIKTAQYIGIVVGGSVGGTVQFRWAASALDEFNAVIVYIHSSLAAWKMG